MARQKLGQHFLADTNVITQILQSAKLTDQDQVLEIGPGRGALTNRLVQTARQVVAVEVDKSLAFKLTPHNNLRIVLQDILQTDLSSVLAPPTPITYAYKGLEASTAPNTVNGPQEQSSKAAAVAGSDQSSNNWKVIANLPYYITTPIIERLLNYTNLCMQPTLEQPTPEQPALPRITSMILMIQHEVAERMASMACRQAGSLSYFVNYHAQVKYLFRVKPESFSPPPQVDSAVIELISYTTPPVQAEREVLFQVVRTAFQERRKMLKRSLLRLATEHNLDVNDWLEAAQVGPTRRPETLTLDEFAALARILAPTQAQ